MINSLCSLSLQNASTYLVALLCTRSKILEQHCLLLLSIVVSIEFPASNPTSYLDYTCSACEPILICDGFIFKAGGPY